MSVTAFPKPPFLRSPAEDRTSRSTHLRSTGYCVRIFPPAAPPLCCPSISQGNHSSWHRPLVYYGVRILYPVYFVRTTLCTEMRQMGASEFRRLTPLRSNGLLSFPAISAASTDSSASNLSRVQRRWRCRHKKHAHPRNASGLSEPAMICKTVSNPGLSPMEIVTDEALELKSIRFGLNLTRSCISLVHNLSPPKCPPIFPALSCLPAWA